MICSGILDKYITIIFFKTVVNNFDKIVFYLFINLSYQIYMNIHTVMIRLVLYNFLTTEWLIVLYITTLVSDII